MQKRKRRYEKNSVILCALIFFVITATAFCMVVDGREAAQKRRKYAEVQKAEQMQKEAEEKQQKERAEQMSVRPGVPIGTLEPDANEKVVYLTFDDGPSENTEKVLDVLKQYDVKATFFITGSGEEYRPMIRRAYEEGHTIGLHTYSHKYEEVYASEDAYFADLEKVGKIAEEQIGFVPCFIRFPGGASNTVSAKYKQGIMTQLTGKVQEKGYQYYDWNVDSGDGAGYKKDQIVSASKTDRYQHIMLLLHDGRSKEETVKALPEIIEYYKNQGYEFRPVDRQSFVSHHATLN